MELYNVPNRTYVRVLPQLDGDNPDDQREMSEKAKDILGWLPKINLQDYVKGIIGK